MNQNIGISDSACCRWRRPIEHISVSYSVTSAYPWPPLPFDKITLLEYFLRDIKANVRNGLGCVWNRFSLPFRLGLIIFVVTTTSHKALFRFICSKHYYANKVTFHCSSYESRDVSFSDTTSYSQRFIFLICLIASELHVVSVTMAYPAGPGVRTNSPSCHSVKALSLMLNWQTLFSPLGKPAERAIYIFSILLW